MIRKIITALDEHWFGPLPSVYLSLTRVVVFGAVLLSLLIPIPGGQLALLSSQQWFLGTDETLYTPIPTLKVLLLPFGGWGTVRPDAAFLQGVWLLAVASAVGAILGIRTRLSMICCAATVTLLVAHGYSYQEFHHPQAPLIITLWVLAVAPITGTTTWRGFVARAREAVRARKLRPRSPGTEVLPLIRWPLRLVQWLLVLVYLSAGISKLIDGGLDWMNGHTLAYYLAQDGTFFRGGQGPGMWLAQNLWIMTLLAAGTLVFELTFVFAVLFPRVAWVYVVAGAAMHTLIYIAQRAPFFQFVLLYIVFAESVYLSLKAARAAVKRMHLPALPSRRREASQQAT